MKNIFIGNTIYRVIVTCSNGEYTCYYTQDETGKITDRFGLDKTNSFIGGKYNATNAETIVYATPQELINTDKYVKALTAHGLTEQEAITCLKEFHGKCKGKSYKKVAAEIMERATCTYSTYDDKYPPRGYYNSWLDDLRGIDNRDEWAKCVAI